MRIVRKEREMPRPVRAGVDREVWLWVEFGLAERIVTACEGEGEGVGDGVVVVVVEGGGGDEVCEVEAVER